ncbi:RNA methyltransferase [Microvirga sp. W0021]|uniref:RNA methyltransferase n=1 Tax=Hohaiivirga grylli TaxID=3133970 RepID=A0ABV0BKQ6_9HYPH
MSSGSRNSNPNQRKPKNFSAGWKYKQGNRNQRPAFSRPGDIDVAIIYGWHPVFEALSNPVRKFKRLLATENSAKKLAEKMPQLPIEPTIVKPGDITHLLEPDAVHQGIYLEAAPLCSPTLETLSNNGIVLALDQITDPHNVGAIVRTAAAFNVEAIITTARHSPAATGVLAKSASGGLEHAPFLVVKNLAEALIKLGERGFQRVGLDSDGEADMGNLSLKRPLVLVLGAEGKGLRQRTRECCDVIGRLDMPGQIKSLNVSNAAAISLYAVSKAT